MVSINQNIFTATINAPTVAGTATSTASGAVSGAPSATANVATSSTYILSDVQAPKTSPVSGTPIVNFTPTAEVVNTNDVMISPSVSVLTPENYKQLYDEIKNLLAEAREVKNNKEGYRSACAVLPDGKFDKNDSNYNKMLSCSSRLESLRFTIEKKLNDLGVTKNHELYNEFCELFNVGPILII